LIELSKYVLEALWRDAEFILYRGRGKDYPSQVFVLSPVAEYPAPASLKRLEHEYSFKEDLDSNWALRPIAIARHSERMVLVTEDPGGVPLNQLFGRGLDLALSLRLAVGLSVAIGHLHRSGIIHKDIKPANVLVNSITGQCWLRGFGIASRLLRERQSPEPPESLAGTLAYMAPEQTGRMNRSIDSRSDLYAFGVTLYEMLTGSLPFTGSDPIEWVHCHIARQLMPPRERVKDIPESVSAIVTKLLAKTAEQRYQTAAGVEADLRHCLADWESGGQIKPFSLGARDARDRLVIPEKLYGRDQERKELLRAFDRVVAAGELEIVLVSGYSGIGKSSVVNELHKELVPSRGLFAEGKFDQYERDVPYATLAEAFQTLVRQILVKSDAEICLWREALREALGLNGQLIVNLIPKLEFIIGKQPPIPNVSPQDRYHRFQMVFRRFLGVFARAEHPLVLFLDDLQWVDPATLDLLKYLITEPDLRHLLLLGAYRDNEVSPSHPLLQMLEQIRKAGAAVQEIVLKPLSMVHVHQLIVDSLQCEPERAEPLAQLIHEKTGGNPFFAIQFLTTLADEGFLGFDSNTGAWIWNLARIRAKGFTDNVVDLVAEKLGRLPESTREALQQLAFLGNSAGIAALNIVRGDSEEELHAALWEAVRAGLVSRLDGTYAFMHDRVQEAAYTIVPEVARPALHLRIGRLLMSKMTPDQVAENIFDVVKQLDLGAELIVESNERERVADLYLRAGRKAKASVAYDSASVYFSAGRRLLEENAWRSRYELAFGLWLDSAECEYLNGNFGLAELLISELLQRSASKIDKAAVYRLRIDLHLIQSEYAKAVEYALECLRLFGIEMQLHATEQEVNVEYEKIWQNLGDDSIENLVDRPLMVDPEKQAAMRVLAALVGPTLDSQPNLLHLHLFHMINLSLKHGTADATPHAYAWFGLILGPFAQRYADGYCFGKVACDLIEKHGFVAYQAKTYFCMELICCWTQPIHIAIDFIRAAFRAAIETGDLPVACYCCNHLVTDFLLKGIHLDEVWRESKKSLEFDRKSKSRLCADIVVSQQRFIENMRGNTLNFSTFSDGQFDEETFEAQLAQAGTTTLGCWYWILKLEARFMSGDFDQAADAAEKAKAVILGTHGHIQLLGYHYYGALVIAALYPNVRSDRQGALREAFTAHLNQLREWASSCPATFLDKYKLVSAELARIEGRELDAMALYEEAIRAARENGFVQNEALGNELAARFFLNRRLDKVAHSYLRDARYCYLRWGALGKVRQIDLHYPSLSEERPPSPATTIETAVEQLDLGTVMKASQAVSGEILLEQLVQTLIGIAVEHAGAGRGLLILPSGEEYRIAAEARTDRDEVAVQLRHASVTPSDLPDSLLRYVIRTQESVILDDASDQNLFSDDEYIRLQHSRSILCLPLVKQAKLMGVLYLENNLAPGVFTTRRLAMLELLASQAAISLDNARLYADLAQENNDRRKAEEALRASEERWSRLAENSSAGIALIASDGRFIAANQALQNMLGYSEDELKVRTASDITHQEDRAATESRIQEAYEDRRRNFRLEKRYLRKDGRVVWADVSSVFVPASGNSSAFFSVVIVDRTAYKLAEEALRHKEASLSEAQAELAHISRVTTMGELVASIAHEVNQPLAGAAANASASLRWLAAHPPNFTEAFEAIRRNIRDVNRAGEIIGRIRALAKKAPPQKDRLNLNETVSEVVAMTSSLVERNRISLHTQLASDLPLVLGDRIQLQQVILNLLINAVEALSGIVEGPRELWVSSKKVPGTASESTTESQFTHVAIAVRDSGPGLDPKILNRIFDAFYTTKTAGLGMGLAISQSIIQAHGGRLWADAIPSGGSIFQFALPIDDGKGS
jgi:PAS domain S-box-containing protein